MARLLSRPSLSPVARGLIFGLTMLILVGSGLSLAVSLPQAPPTGASLVATTYPADLRQAYATICQRVRTLEDLQSHTHQSVVSDAVLQQALSQVQLDANTRNYKLARADIKQLQQRLDGWTRQLTSSSSAPLASASPGGVFLPILIYHYTPANFAAQLDALAQKHYTVIDLQTVSAALRGTSALPPKPAVITFDDGFANQMQAFDILKQHNMKATFYIINGGPVSRWCIGASRRYNDPLQPPSGCGDAYLDWDQIHQLDASGLITIGAHTIDHANLASLSADQQRAEIFDSKYDLEQHLGHPVYTFAYPYGAYNATTVQLVQEAGFTSAVTTLDGTSQTPGDLFTLHRVRNALTLP